MLTGLTLVIKKSGFRCKTALSGLGIMTGFFIVALEQLRIADYHFKVELWQKRTHISLLHLYLIRSILLVIFRLFALFAIQYRQSIS